ncbi:glutamine synthetase family protein [Myxococcota bacterium]
MASIEEIIELLRDIDSVKIFFTDLNGRPMGLPVNPEDIGLIIKGGIGFDGSSIAGVSTVDDSDRLLFPVPDSFRLLTFDDEKHGFLIGQIFNHDMQRSACDCRALLERVIDHAEREHGLRFIVGPEHEFFLLTGDEFSDKLHSDKAGYFRDGFHDKGEFVRKKVIRVLRDCGIHFEKAHHEVTPSQHEINLRAADPLMAADRTLLFTYVAQKVAAGNGYHATFMPKPFDGFNRNAFHIHLSMQDLEGNNLFYNETAEHHLSDEARFFIGGILKFARETSIVMAATHNSYKAYVAEREAPVVRGWGVKNRSSMVRLPYAHGPHNTRIELRSPDPSGNVYLQIATYIAMGLRGIEQKLECGKPDVGNTYKRIRTKRLWDPKSLPKCMFEALVEAEQSRFLKALLGPELHNNYLSLKIDDWEDHRTHVTSREHEKYLR